MILVVDTALDIASAALVVDGRVAGEASAPADGDAERVVVHAAAALRSAGAGWPDVRAVVVTVGPGSFTGVRVGIAFAKGVAFARGIPATGVSTLAALAAAAGGDAVAVVDARHGQVFAALVRSGRVTLAARMSAADARRLAADHGVPLAGPPGALDAAGGAGVPVPRIAPLAIVRAAGTAGIAPPSALYLAPVDATPQRHKGLARAPA